MAQQTVDELTVQIAQAHAHLQDLYDQLAKTNDYVRKGQACFKHLFHIKHKNALLIECDALVANMLENLTSYSKRYEQEDTTYRPDGTGTIEFGFKDGSKMNIKAEFHTAFNEIVTSVQFTNSIGVSEVARDEDGFEIRKGMSPTFKLLIKRLNRKMNKNDRLIDELF